MRFSINIYQDEDGVYIAECPSVPCCLSQGATLEEAETNIKDAIRECLEVRQDLKMPLIVHSREVEVLI